jgi:hypothetical protein
MSTSTSDLMPIDVMREHFLSVYLETTDSERDKGRAWYPQVHAMIRKLARETGTTRNRAAAIFSVYSTNNSWKGNQTMARNACLGNPRGMKSVLAKVERVLAGENPSKVITSDKLRNFYRNLAGDYNAVTVDRWMARLADADNGSQPNGARYAHIAQAIREAAEDVGETPAAMQAILWVAIRGASE